MISKRVFVSNVFRVYNNTRCLSVTAIKEEQSITRKSRPYSVKPISDQIVQNFAAYYPKFVRTVLDDDIFQDMTQSDKKQFKHMLDYNVPFGYKRIPYFMLSTYHSIEQPSNITEQKLDAMNFLGWCIQMIQTSYQILDDIVDQTETRSTRPCWHTKEENGMNAIIDGLLLNFLIPNLISRHFSNHKHFQQMLQLVNHMNLTSTIGERIQLSQCRWHDMTMDRWTKIAYKKASCHLCLTPFKIAMFMTDTYSEEKFTRIEPILLDFGMLMQMINDNLDAFPKNGQPVGDPTDIKDGKCSWLLVNALELANPSQKRTIKDNYGKREDSSVEKVLNVYRDLGLREYGRISKNQINEDIQRRIDELPPDYPKESLINGLLIAYHGY